MKMTGSKEKKGMRSLEMKEKTPLPKKTSTPLKSTLENLHSSLVREMLSGKNVPKRPLKSINGKIALSMLKEMTSGKNVPKRPLKSILEKLSSSAENAMLTTYNPPKKIKKGKSTMNIQQMAAQARQHWKVTNPEIYRQMVEDKALMECSEAAAKLTMREIKTLMLGGLTEAEAWQESRHLFIFKTAEQIEKSYQPDRDENGKAILHLQ